MHKFIDNIVAFSLKNKFFIFFCTTVAGRDSGDCVIQAYAHRCVPGRDQYQGDGDYPMAGAECRGGGEIHHDSY